MKNWTFHDGQTVNRLGFGAMRLTGQPGNWGPYSDKERAARVFRLALEMGVNFIDTAFSYSAGHSEMLIAEILHPYPKGLMIATKGGVIKTGPGEIRIDGSHIQGRRPGHQRRRRRRNGVLHRRRIGRGQHRAGRQGEDRRTLNAGEVFGEMSLIVPRPRTVETTRQMK